MKKLTLAFLLLGAATGAFAQKTAKTKKKKSANDIVSVSMHRTVCFGQCPDYIIDINASGMATYTARMFTPDTGVFRKNIGKAKATEIIALFKKYRVDTCSEVYENPLSDLPGLNMYINYKKGKKKSVYNCSFGPAFLKDIAETMEAVGKKEEINDKTWKKTGMPKML
jgi:hypothetical protein